MAASKRLKPIVFVMALLPLGFLIWQIVANLLGPDPAKAIVQFTGDWAIRFLVLTLAITPLKAVTGWSVLLRYRRMMGLYVMFYASLHLLAYLAFLLQWQGLFEDIQKRPYITVGFSAFVMLVPLALTSTKGMIRKLGRRWKSLHKSIYFIAVLVCIHFLWLARSDLGEPLLYIAIFGVLLGYRVAKSSKLRAIWRGVEQLG